MKFEMDKVGRRILNSSEVEVGEIICGKNSGSIYKVKKKMISKNKLAVVDMSINYVKVITLGDSWAHHKYNDYDEIKSEDW